ncbi:hypothetical protein CLV98_10984 [Dyadobacter jejuensis]|uniref:Uncharacterized protein n=1 Tax=Dyadobacter jejuensis TaxID=1082580 RepID=A0A316AGQ1_9BACT|nr:hypothetical protein [Dyadobacter jejuensis]PWJ56975.1 hypothetical protein CLV98_10984 [Dyadobacter jejuensis]
MKTKKLFSRVLTVLMAAMVLMVAAGRSWPMAETILPAEQSESVSLASQAETGQDQAPLGKDAVLRTLHLNAVITPSLSYDFLQYFYIIPSPIWRVLEGFVYQSTLAPSVAVLYSTFSRIFGVSIVTNAP